VASKKKSARPARKSAKKSATKKVATKRAATKKSSVKKAASKKVASKKVASKKVASKKKSTVKKSSAKRPIKKALPKRPAGVDATKIVIPPVPTRGDSATSNTTPVAAKPVTTSTTPAKKNSSSVLFLVIAGVVLLAIFALSNSSSDDDAAPKPTASESVTEEPTEEPSEEPSETESPSNLVYEAPTGFVAINNGNGGVTLRWKAPAATEGLTGYLVSISYNTVDFIELGNLSAEELTLNVAKMGDEGGTQFFIQSVYSDGTKADGAKFALKGKYGN
jgi:hypothetical protein